MWKAVEGHVIWIEGIIGAGKTTLTHSIAKAMNLRPILEPVDANFLLKDFYSDPKQWAFAVQMLLLGMRWNLQTAAAAEAMGCMEYSGAVLDRGLPGDRVFAKMLLESGEIHPKEFQVYEKHFAIMSTTLRPPSLLVYLDVDPEVALYRVQHRDRSMEVGISINYLTRLKSGYEDLLAEIESGKHVWSRGIRVLRVPWNIPHIPSATVVEQIRNVLGD